MINNLKYINGDDNFENTFKTINNNFKILDINNILSQLSTQGLMTSKDVLALATGYSVTSEIATDSQKGSESSSNKALSLYKGITTVKNGQYPPVIEDDFNLTEFSATEYSDVLNSDDDKFVSLVSTSNNQIPNFKFNIDLYQSFLDNYGSDVFTMTNPDFIDRSSSTEFLNKLIKTVNVKLQVRCETVIGGINKVYLLVKDSNYSEQNKSWKIDKDYSITDSFSEVEFSMNYQDYINNNLTKDPSYDFIISGPDISTMTDRVSLTIDSVSVSYTFNYSLKDYFISKSDYLTGYLALFQAITKNASDISTNARNIQTNTNTAKNAIYFDSATKQTKNVNGTVISPIVNVSQISDFSSSVKDIKVDSALKADSATTASSADTATSATTAFEASKLKTSRKINGVTFDGTSDITLTADNLSAYTKTQVDTLVNNTQVVSGENVHLGYGVYAYVRRRGEIVSISVLSNQTSNRPNDYVSTWGTISSMYRPKEDISFTCSVSVGSALTASRVEVIVNKTGVIQTIGYDSLKSPITLRGTAAWVR